MLIIVAKLFQLVRRQIIRLSGHQTFLSVAKLSDCIFEVEYFINMSEELYFFKFDKEKANGLDLFYEIGFKTPVRVFHHYLSEYELISNTTLAHDCQAADLINFLNYVICYAGELSLFLNINYYKEPVDIEEDQTIRNIIKEIDESPHSYYYTLAMDEFNKRLSDFEQTMQLVPPLIAFRKSKENASSYIMPEELAEVEQKESELLNLASQLYIALAIKEKLAGYEGQVKMLHSY